MKNVVLVDYKSKSDRNFTEYLNLETQLDFEEVSCVSNGTQKGFLKKFIRYFKYFFFPFKIFMKRKHINIVVAWQQFYGTILAFYCRLFHVKVFPRIYVMSFIYIPKNGILGKIYFRFLRKTISSKYVFKICVYTTQEIERYSNIFSISKDKFVFIPDGVSNDQKNIMSVEKKNYYLSAGRTNRDYDFLINAWPENGPQLYILCDVYSKKTTKENVNILRNVFGESYLKMLKECKALILTLGNENVSSGQLSFINALKMEKAIIVVENECIKDYAVDGENCIIVKKDSQSFQDLIGKIETGMIDLSRLENKAYNYFKSHFTIENMAQQLGQIINVDSKSS